MPAPSQRGRRKPRVRRPHRRAVQPGVVPSECAALPQRWRTTFFEALAETSNVVRACALAGVSKGTVYDLRRRDIGFAQRWAEALAEGYDNLEMELLDRLRNGETGEARYNYAVAVRALLAHREAVGREKGRRISVDAADVRASILRKIAEMREHVLAETGHEAQALPAPEADRSGDDRARP
jgi:hypothetical protein